MDNMIQYVAIAIIVIILLMVYINKQKASVKDKDLINIIGLPAPVPAPAPAPAHITEDIPTNTVQNITDSIPVVTKQAPEAPVASEISIPKQIATEVYIPRKTIDVVPVEIVVVPEAPVAPTIAPRDPDAVDYLNDPANYVSVGGDTSINLIVFLNPNADGDWSHSMNIAEVMVYDNNKNKMPYIGCNPDDPAKYIGGTINISDSPDYAEINESNVSYGKCDYLMDNNLYSFHHSLPQRGSIVTLQLSTTSIPIENLSYIYVRNRFDKNTRNRLNGVVMYLTNSKPGSMKVIKKFTLTNELNQYFPINLNSNILSFEKTTLINIDKPEGGIINLGELKVYDINGILLDVNAYKIIYDNQWIFSNSMGPATNLFDKDNNTVYHSNGSGDSKKISLQLIKPEVIAKVIVINRLDCCQDRAIGVTISLFGESSNIIDKLILSDAKEMSFYPQLKLK